MNRGVKYRHKGKNAKLERQTGKPPLGRTLLLHAALYVEFQRTALSLLSHILFISESQDHLHNS